jgi:hypothetical protein
MNNTTAVRTTAANGKQIVTITRGETVIVRKGKAEVRKPFASTCIANGETHAFISIKFGEEFAWATEWEHVEITGEPVA